MFVIAEIYNSDSFFSENFAQEKHIQPVAAITFYLDFVTAISNRIIKPNTFLLTIDQSEEFSN